MEAHNPSINSSELPTQIPPTAAEEASQEFRVFGPPGTGKTTYLAKQVGRAVERWGDKGVLVASFTKAAAKEIAMRDLGKIDDSHVGTLHSLAYQSIGRPKLATDKTLLPEWNERHPEFALSGKGRSLDDPDGGSSEEGKKAGDEVFEEYDRLRARRRARTMWPERVLAFAEPWEAFKADTNSVDFTDMIERALLESPVAPGRPDVGFFDEVQDFSKLELDLVRSWSKAMRRVVLAGDDDQAIYGFRGATPDAFLEPSIDPRREIVLSQSYRVPRAVHGLASRWVSQLAYRKEKRYEPRPADGAVWRSPSTFDDPQLLLDLAEEHAAAGKSFLLLASCGYQLRGAIKELRQRGVPFHNPWAGRRGDWNPLAKRRGTSAVDRLLAFLRPDESIFGNAAPDLWPLKDFQAWAEWVRADSVFVRGAKTKIATADRLTLDDLRSWFKPEALGPALDLNLEWFESVLLAEKDKSMTFPLAVLRTRGAKGLREEPKVIVSTIHASKGGQADTVALFPDLSPAGLREWQSSLSDRVVRQFYVGLTRAKETLVLCRPSGPNAVEL
jgi:DNA helicase-2/ATP-dependent DNA helicase PcrA